MLKKIALIIPMIVLTLNTAFISPAAACYGVRAMGMGGAFIAVADDVNAVYWNPAGLTQLQEPQVAMQHVADNRNNINYLDVLAYAAPIGQGAIGYTLVKEWAVVRDVNHYRSNWGVLSLAEPVGANLALGVNLRVVYEELYINNTLVDDDTSAGLDLSLFYKKDKWSVGLLIQDANQPKTLGDVVYARNVRPGIAYRPDDKTVIAFDVYDATNELERQYSIGAEHAVTGKLKARIGNYHGSMTYGFGYQGNRHLEWNYAYLAGNLGGTNLVGFLAKF